MSGNNNERYDVIIPVAGKDLDFLPWVIKYAKYNLLEAENIYVITKQELIKKAKRILDRFEGKKRNEMHYDDVDLTIREFKPRMDPNEVKVFFLDEDNVVPNLSYLKIRELLKKYGLDPGRTGWYFQQFLKFGFPFSSYCNKYYLTLDSDTLPLVPLKFFKDGHPLFTVKSEYHPAYFSTIKKLLNIERQSELSFISEMVLFNKEIMISLVNEISILDSHVQWYENVLSSFNLEEQEPYFSEFETYGNYSMVHSPGFYSFRHLNTFRRAGLIKGRFIDDTMLKKLSFDLDIASFEAYDGPLWARVLSKSPKQIIKSFINRFR